MARRDFLKRALNVTADTLEATPPAAPVKSSTTGPGAMMAFMKDRSEVHKELEAAQAKLAQFDGAFVTRLLDPKTIHPSAWANRIEPSFSDTAFENLKAEIATSEGNVQPIKVRRIGGEVNSYEIVFGHRRHRACLELGLPVLASIVENMPDSVLFAEMDRENRNRADLSVYEQGRAYLRALDDALFPSQRQLATALGVNLALVSRAVAIAKLPTEVIQAFASPLDLQYRWAEPLRDAQQRDPEALLARARAIVSLDKRPEASEILKRLTSAGEPAMSFNKEWTDSKGKRTARVTVDKKGRAVVAFEKRLSETEFQHLLKMVEQLAS